MQAEVQAQVKSGYLLSAERCGPYSKLRITMQPGLCAGLVAAKDHVLIFPRTLVQVPGPDGKTVYVTQRQGGFIETFRVDRPGREFCLLRDSGDPACR